MKFVLIPIQHFLKTFSLLFFFVYLLLGQMPQQGVVLCIENNGKMVLEPSADGVSCSYDSNPKLVGPSAHCGECLDVSLSEEYKFLNKSSAQHKDYDIIIPQTLPTLTRVLLSDSGFLQNTYQRTHVIIPPTSVFHQKTVFLL